MAEPRIETQRQKPGVAAFDVDGTLTSRDCVVPFMRAVNGTLKTVAALAVRAHRLVPALVRRDRDTIKALSSHAVFAGRAIAEVNNAGRIFCDQVIRWLREDTLDLVREHQANGDDVVLVSASYGAYLRPLGERLGVIGVIGTELVVDGAGCCTGALDGGNCRGDQKVVRLHAWLAEHRGGRDAVELWAYGDSAGDLAMLGDADHAVWLGDERKRPARVRTTSS